MKFLVALDLAYFKAQEMSERLWTFLNCKLMLIGNCLVESRELLILK